ncbi:MAG TPA: phosphodiester glycosidase family protein [Rhodanobacteraceae bacterium]|nr:phosphodiester glycosidase family protein [Rhodanobacteraceae bacterium]
MRFAFPSRIAAALLVSACLASRADALESRVVRAGDADVRVVTLDLSRETLALRWLDADGQPYGSIEALKRAAEADGQTLEFATNAGMYDRENRPLGLTIADGRTLRPLNTTRGRSGNFAIQPNGVFYVDKAGNAGVVATGAWRERAIDARIATQSGPMLVVDGEINANFVEASDSRKWRSGVCAPSPRRVAFAVSDAPITFHAFASVFRDALECRDALYLDGTLSRIWTAAGGYSGAPAVMVKPYAAMLAVFGAPSSAD